MSKLEELIQELCPNGVEYKKLGEIVEYQRGKSITKKNVTEGDIPVISGGQQPAYYHNESNREGKTITIAGSGAYAGYIMYWEKPIFVSDAFSLKGNEININTKYIYYYLKKIQEKIYSLRKGAGISHVYFKDMQDFLVPVPPLEVQCEIVRILDKFTLLTAELTAELTVRSRQYEYYRNKLLFLKNTEAIKYRALKEIANFRRGSFPQPYGNSEWFDGEGAMPFVQVVDIGKDMILVDDTKRKISKLAQPKSIFAPKGSILISLQGSIGRVAVTQYDSYIDRTVAIFTELSNEVIPKYFAYQIQNVFEIKEKTARGSTIKTITKGEFSDFEILVPTLQEQERIVSILDKFNDLNSSMYTGIPAEIETRQKQYEYYRDKLLTFKEKNNE